MTALSGLQKNTELGTKRRTTMKDYGMAMEFDTMEVWNKLSGGKPLSDNPVYYDANADLRPTTDLILADFQKAMDRVMREKRGK